MPLPVATVAMRAAPAHAQAQETGEEDAHADVVVLDGAQGSLALSACLSGSDGSGSTA